MVKKKAAGRGSQKPFPARAGGTAGERKATRASKTSNPFAGLGGGSKGAPKTTAAAKSSGKVMSGLAGGPTGRFSPRGAAVGRSGAASGR